MDLWRPKLILASGSPRRAEILMAVGWSFEKRVADVDESLLDGESPRDYVQRLAKAKAEAVACDLRVGIVLGADTTVVVNEQILGQPVGKSDAVRMLKLLSGKWHEVLTGVALVEVEQARSFIDCETTRVRFAQMTDDEIGWYVQTGEPMGKAGAYAVQGKAALFIDRIEGDYFNVVGLPLGLLYRMVNRHFTND